MDSARGFPGVLLLFAHVDRVGFSGRRMFWMSLDTWVHDEHVDLTVSWIRPTRTRETGNSMRLPSTRRMNRFWSAIPGSVAARSVSMTIPSQIRRMLPQPFAAHVSWYTPIPPTASSSHEAPAVIALVRCKVQERGRRIMIQIQRPLQVIRCNDYSGIHWFRSGLQRSMGHAVQNHFARYLPIKTPAGKRAMDSMADIPAIMKVSPASHDDRKKLQSISRGMQATAMVQMKPDNWAGKSSLSLT